MKIIRQIIVIAIIIAVQILMLPLLKAGQPPRQFREVKLAGEVVEIRVSDGRYVIALLNDHIVHTSFYPDGKPQKDFSFAPVHSPKMVEFTIAEDESKVSVTTKGIQLRINKSPFSITYFHNGNRLISEIANYRRGDSLNVIDLGIEPDEVLYGGGARALGMNRRGNRLMLYNRAHYGYEERSELMNYTLPLFMSSNKYAVLFDNAGSGILDLDSKKTNEVSYESASGIANYYLIAGEDWYDLVKKYTLLTGRQPLPPRWAFGNFSSRFGYHSQKETEATVKKFIREGIPLDAVIIDIYWFGKEIQGSMGNLDWLRDSFPNPQRMMKQFQKKGIKTILVTEPFILTTSNRWKEAVDRKVLCTGDDGKPFTYDFYFGNTGLVDIFEPAAREWFWNIYKGLVQQGVGGWWGDLGEPEVHPSALRHFSGKADELHNAYGHEWAGMIYEGYHRDFPDTRPFILMRAGYAGSQRYGMIPWSGDVNRTWGGLVPQPEISLQMGMQGLAYMHSDLGGFAGGDTINNELYTRWLQYGVFQPVYRPHAQEHIPAEPVFQNATTKARAKEAIELRYALLPYIYNMAFENSQSGKPLMIPLFFNEPDNPDLLTYDTAYMWGSAFLVSPVKSPGLTTQRVYLPAGHNWTDFYTGETFRGGQYIRAKLEPGHIPVYIRGGAFIPMKQGLKSTAEYSLDHFELHYYSDTTVEKSSYCLYNDDGETPGAIEKGRYEFIDFAACETETSLTIEIVKTKAEGHFARSQHNITLFVHNLAEKPAGMKINGAVVAPNQWSWDAGNKTLNLKTGNTGDKMEIEILRRLY